MSSTLPPRSTERPGAYRADTIARVNFDLTSEQELVRDTVRSFARDRVAPVAAELDLEGRFPYELVMVVNW